MQAENHEHVVFPNAMIAGDCVITDLLGRLGLLKNGKAKIMVVDTFHLFPETMVFLDEMEKHYDFKAEVPSSSSLLLSSLELSDTQVYDTSPPRNRFKFLAEIPLEPHRKT